MPGAEFPFSVVLKAVDRATAPIRRVSQRLERFQARVGRTFRPLGTSLAGVGTQLSILGRRFAIVGGIGAAAGAALVRSYASAGDDIAKTSLRLGLSVEKLQEFRFAAEQSGVKAATFDMAMQRLGRRVGEAAKGMGEARGALQELGISAVDSSGNVRTLDSLLPEVADKLGALENANQRNALAMKLFDSEGVALVQMFGEGAAGLEKLGAQARAFGILSADDARATEVFTDRMGALGAALLGVRNRIGSAVLPVLTDLAEKGIQLILDKGPAIKEWADRFARELPGRLEQIKVGLIKVRDFLQPVIDLGKTLADRFGGLNVVVAAVSAALLGPLVVALGSVGSALVGLGTILLANPWAIAIAGVVALVAKLGGLKKILGAVKNAAVGAFNFIADKLGFGDGDSSPAAAPARSTASIAETAVAARQRAQVQVDFANTPAGTRVAQGSNDGVDLTLNMGYALQGTA